MAIKIRPSDVLRFEMCPKSYEISKQGWRALQPSSNLAFGTAIHAMVEAVIKRVVETGEEAKAVFRDSWDKAMASAPLKFSKNMPQDKMERVGQGMAETFPEVWVESGFEPVMNTDNELLIEKRMEVEVSPGVVLSAQPDAIVWTRDGDLAVIDYKTAASSALPEFEGVSDQLTAYQIVLDAYAEKFGTPLVSKVGFFEAIKRLTKPWNLPRMSDRRTPDQVDEYLNKVRWMAGDIQNGHLPRRSLMAWNSPCKMCDYFNLCHHGKPDNVCRKTIIHEKDVEYSDEWF